MRHQTSRPVSQTFVISGWKNFKWVFIELGGLALLWLARGVSAHALLLKSDPQDDAILTQPPAQVLAWFSQELDTKFSALQVLEARGRQVDNGDGGVDLNDPTHASLKVSLPSSMAPGVYTVHWVAVSAEDGDTTEGEFSFSIGETAATMPGVSMSQTEPIAAAAWPVSWLVASSIGVLLLVGLALMLLSRRKERLS